MEPAKRAKIRDDIQTDFLSLSSLPKEILAKIFVLIYDEHIVKDEVMSLAPMRDLLRRSKVSSWFRAASLFSIRFIQYIYIPLHVHCISASFLDNLCSVRSLYLDATEDMRVGTVAAVIEQIHLKHFPIRTMRIQIYEAAPRKILKDLPVLSKLRTLTLDSIHMTSNSMKQILRIAPNLKNLILDYETITRARYPVLSSVTNLHVSTEYDEETSARIISNCFPSLKVLSLSTFSFWRTKMTISSATLQFLCVRTAGFQLQLNTPAVRSIWIYGGCSAVPAVTLVKPAPELGIVEIFREFTTFEAEEDEEFMLQNGEMKRLGSWIASGKAPNLQCVVWMGPAEFLFCPTSHFPICLRVSDYPSDREVVYGFCRTNNWMELRALRSRLQRAALMR